MATIWSIKSSKRNFVWSLHRMMDSVGRVRVQTFCDKFKDVACNKRLLPCITSLDNICAAEFKSISNEGFVFIATKPRDLGNYVYSLFFDALYRTLCCDETVVTNLGNHYNGLLGAMNSLCDRYESMRLQHPPTDAMLIRKGDFIEFLLADARLSGDVNLDVQYQREALHMHFHNLNDLFSDLLKSMTDCNDGAPNIDAFPPPGILCKLIFFALLNHGDFTKLAHQITIEQNWMYSLKFPTNIGVLRHVHIIYDGPPQQQPAYAVPTNAVAIESYDGLENGICGRVENGYLPIAVDDIVEILSPSFFGHARNKKAHYFYGRKSVFIQSRFHVESLMLYQEGWFPSTCLK